MTEPTPGEFTLLGPDGQLIAHGSMSAITEMVLDSTSRRAAEQLVKDAQRADALLDSIREQRRQVRDDTIRLAHSKLSNLVKRMDALEAEEREQQRQDAEEEQREIKKYLDNLPDPDDPDGHEDPDDRDESSGHGELTLKGPPDQKRYTAGEDDQGDLPEELEAEVPTTTGNYFDPDPDDPDPDDPPLVRDPPSASLNGA